MQIKEHHFDIEDAKKHGVNKAILLYNLKYWLDKNKANRRNIHQHKSKLYYWTYNSANAFSKLFPYFSVSSIDRWLRELETDGYLISANYNKIKFDKTKLNEEELRKYNSLDDVEKVSYGQAYVDKANKASVAPTGGNEPPIDTTKEEEGGGITDSLDISSGLSANSIGSIINSDIDPSAQYAKSEIERIEAKGGVAPTDLYMLEGALSEGADYGGKGMSIGGPWGLLAGATYGNIKGAIEGKETGRQAKKDKVTREIAGKAQFEEVFKKGGVVKKYSKDGRTTVLRGKCGGVPAGMQAGPQDGSGHGKKAKDGAIIRKKNKMKQADKQPKTRKKVTIIKKKK